MATIDYVLMQTLLGGNGALLPGHGQYQLVAVQAGSDPGAAPPGSERQLLEAEWKQYYAGHQDDGGMWRSVDKLTMAQLRDAIRDAKGAAPAATSGRWSDVMVGTADSLGREQEQQQWRRKMLNIATDDSMPTCEDRHKRRMVNQDSVIHYVGEQIRHWKDSNTKWSAAAAAAAQGPDGKLKPPPKPGLLVYHNVGGGKTATQLGVALRARAQWPKDLTVIIAADPEQVALLQRDLPDEYALMGVSKGTAAPEKTTLNLDGGGGGRAWQPRGLRLPQTVTAFKPLRRARRQHDSAVVLSMSDAVKNALVDATAGVPLRERQLLMAYDDPKRRGAKARKFPAGPVLLIIDEAHKLVDSGRSDVMGANYAVMRRFLQQQPPNVYCVLLTATPGSTPSDVAQLCSIVAPAQQRAAIQAVARRGGVTPGKLADFSDAMSGCVDAWNMLGAPMFAPLRFATERVSVEEAPAPFDGAENATRHILATCGGELDLETASITGSTQSTALMTQEEDYVSYVDMLSGTGTGVLPATGENAEIMAETASAAKRLRAQTVMGTPHSAEWVQPPDDAAPVAAQDTTVTVVMRNAVRDAHERAGGSDNDAHLRRRATACKVLANARLYAQFEPQLLARGSHTERARPERVLRRLRDACRKSRDAILSACNEGAVAPPPCELRSLSPRLSLLAMRLLRPVSTPTAAELAAAAAASRGVMPPCKQLVAIPLAGTQMRGYPQQQFVRAVLEDVCGLKLYPVDGQTQEGVQYYIDAVLSGDAAQRLGSQGPFNAGNAAAATALRERAKGAAERPRAAIIAEQLGKPATRKVVADRSAAAQYSGRKASEVTESLAGRMAPIQLGGWTFRSQEAPPAVEAAHRGSYDRLSRQVYGATVPVVLLPNADFCMGYNLLSVQRIHLTDWADPSIMAQAMGRAQRMFGACALPAERRHISVYTYSTGCRPEGSVSSRRSAEVGSVIVRELDTAVAEEGGDLARAAEDAFRALQARGASERGEPPDLRRALEQVKKAARKRRHGGTLAPIDLATAKTLRETRYADLIRGEVDQLSEELRAAQSAGRLVVPPSADQGDKDQLFVEAMRDVPLRLTEAWPRVEQELGRRLAQRKGSRDAYQAAARALRRLVAWRRDAIEPSSSVGIDELLARAYATWYGPVVRLYAALMEASISCAFYGALHAAHGQLAGMPETCGVPQRLSCGAADASCAASGQGARADGDLSIAQAAAQIARGGTAEDIAESIGAVFSVAIAQHCKEADGGCEEVERVAYDLSGI